MSNLLKIGLVANIFEWYEFVIYAYLADIIGQVFFNASDSVSGLIRTFSVFAIGYLARPLGSFFFGIIGDRVGRGRSLKISLLLMAVPTVLIGLLPTYQNIGLLAPALLLALRLIQGFAMGGELTMSGCYIFEAAPDDRKSVLCSMVAVSPILGILLAALVSSLLFLVFDHKMILEWAWRIPFFLSILLTIGICIIRRGIYSSNTITNSIRQVFDFRIFKLSLLKTLPLFSFSTIFFYTLITWLPAYLIHFLDYSPRLSRLVNILVLATLIPSYLGAGHIASLVGYHRLIKIGLTTTILLIIPLWFSFQSASFSAILATQILLALLLSSIEGVIIETLARQFPFSMRCRGMNLACTIPAVFLGGTTPLIFTWMIQKTGLLMFPAFYIMFFGLLALPAAWRLKPVEAFRG